MISTTRKIKTNNQLDILLKNTSLEEQITGVFFQPLIETAKFSVHLANETFPEGGNKDIGNYRITFHHANEEDVEKFAYFPSEVQKILNDYFEAVEEAKKLS
jgi:hypothetical protein